MTNISDLNLQAIGSEYTCPAWLAALSTVSERALISMIIFSPSKLDLTWSVQRYPVVCNIFIPVLSEHRCWILITSSENFLIINWSLITWKATYRSGSMFVCTCWAVSILSFSSWRVWKPFIRTSSVEAGTAAVNEESRERDDRSHRSSMGNYWEGEGVHKYMKS